MKKIFVPIVVLVMLLVSVIPAFAADCTGTACPATVVLTGATLSIVPAPVTLSGVNLNGLAQADIASTGDTQWVVTDPTGTGAGWQVSVVASDFTNTAEKTISKAGFEMKMGAPSKLDDSSNAVPTISGAFADFTAIDSSKVVLTAAAGDGMGQYGFTPSFQLSIPASTYAGSYTSTVTVTLIATP